MSVAGELHEVQRPGARVERVLRPASWLGALEALHEHPDARPVSGGTDLVLELARNPGPAVTLVDLSAVAGAHEIVEEDDEFVLGGGVTHNQIVGDRRFRDHALPLAQACLEIGSPQLRNRATLAGNLATASPANDSISALMALGASVVLSRLVGDTEVHREVPVVGFFRGFRETVCERDELITALRVPKLAPHERGIWVKVGLRKAQAISVVHAGLVLDLHEGLVHRARLALGSVAPIVTENHVLPAALEGHLLTDERIAHAARAVAASISPIDDGRATADYRRAVTETVVARALTTLADDRQAECWPNEPPLLGIRTPSGRARHHEVGDHTDIEVSVDGRTTVGRAAARST
ncbi:MAG: FAD binding domain-containing protein, partial [Actinomycetota bacterium]